MKKLNIAILASGRGSVIPDLLKEIGRKKIPIELKIIVSDKENAGVLEWAKKSGIKTRHVSKQNKTREEHEQIIAEILEKEHIDLILLIGYMRILTKNFTEKWPNKILNTHPSLLPDLAGLMDMDAHRAALKSGKKQTGCTIHIVTEKLDEGRIILQKTCSVETNDTPETLKKKVQQLEPLALAEALEKEIKND